MRVEIILLIAASAHGHGMIRKPPPRNGGNLQWFSQGCMSGCPDCLDCGSGATGDGDLCCSAAQGLTNQTISDDLRTYYVDTEASMNSQVYYHPWRAPGYAPVFDPCGISGGGTWPASPGDGGYPAPGYPRGFPGSELPERSDVNTTWERGSVQETTWGIVANHGGGYSYRLCPKTSKQTEDCFLDGTLDFVGDVQWIERIGSRDEIKAHRTRDTKGNKHWTRNPIPGCEGLLGGALKDDCLGPQFEAPLKERFPATQWKQLPGLYGFGAGTCFSGLPGKTCAPDELSFWVNLFAFSIVDLVQVPDDIVPGEYVLSFRWDGEQTPQIWAGCSDITIV